MRGFDFDQLRSFAAVAEAGSITAAASGLCLSQSSISEQIRKLEERAGAALFLRRKTGVLLTPAGETLLDYAVRILALAEAAHLELRGHGLDGALNLAITDYFRPLDVARMLKRLNQRHPRLRLNVTIRKSAEVQALAESGDCHLGVFMRIAPSSAEGHAKVLRREQLVWVTAADMQAGWGAPLPLVVLPAPCSLHQYVVKLLTRSQVPHILAHTATGVAGIRLAVAAGLGVSCLNESAIGDGIVRLSGGLDLPQLPMVEFCLTPAPAGEAAFVAQARQILATELS